MDVRSHAFQAIAAVNPLMVCVVLGACGELPALVGGTLGDYAIVEVVIPRPERTSFTLKRS